MAPIKFELCSNGTRVPSLINPVHPGALLIIIAPNCSVFIKLIQIWVVPTNINIL